MELTRRELLKLLGVSAGGCAAGVWGASVVCSAPDEVFQRILDGPRIESWKRSVCGLCPGGCGIRVRLIDGIPVRIQGNPLSPINRGAVCPAAEAGIEALFHPDRLRQPLKRTGSRGAGSWQPVSWEEALELLAGRLKRLQEAKTAERLALLRGDRNHLVNRLAARFMQEFGSPRDCEVGWASVAALPVLLTHGVARAPVYDLGHADLVLNFGGDWLDEGPSPVHFNQVYAEIRGGRDGRRGRIVHIGSHLSRTAANSHQWVPVEPGTSGALALAVAHVMIRDASYDRDFVRGNSFGFKDWKDAQGDSHPGFENLVLHEYYPERASEKTGVPAATIVEIARAFASAQSAVAVPGSQLAFSTNGLYSMWAVYCLNALKGNLSKPGGVVFPGQTPLPGFSGAQAPVSLGSDSEGGKAAEAAPAFGPGSSSGFVRSLLEQRGDGVDTLIIRGINPLYESQERDKWLEALRKVPFVACCTPFLDETAAWSDLVLPEPTFLESWDAGLDNPAAEFSHFCVQQPVIEPLYEAVQFGDLLLKLSERLGGSLRRALPWKTYADFVKERVRAIFESGEGAIVSESVESSWIEFLKERGWQAADYSTFEEFWGVLVEKGGWWNPTLPKFDPAKIFQTKSGKFEFYSQTLKEAASHLEPSPSAENRPASLARLWKTDAQGDLLYLPHFEAPRYQKNQLDFPYFLLAYARISNPVGLNVSLELTQEMSGLHSREYWRSWVEINPETARKLDLAEGALVAVTSPKGSLRARVKILPTVLPQVVMMPSGLGQLCGRGGERPTGVNPYEIFHEEIDLITGQPSLISTRVRIEKAVPEEPV